MLKAGKESFRMRMIWRHNFCNRRGLQLLRHEEIGSKHCFYSDLLLMKHCNSISLILLRQTRPIHSIASRRHCSSHQRNHG
jgi:hypothetical protein